MTDRVKAITEAALIIENHANKMIHPMQEIEADNKWKALYYLAVSIPLILGGQTALATNNLQYALKLLNNV
jgi:hypothetical protein